MLLIPQQTQSLRAGTDASGKPERDNPAPIKRRRYDTSFQAKALRSASESRSMQAAARALNIKPKLLYKR